MDTQTTKKNFSYYMRYVFEAFVIVLILYILLGELFMPQEWDRADYVAEEYHGPCMRVNEDGTRTPINVPCTVDTEGEMNLVIEVVIPEMVDDESFFAFKSQRQDLVAYIDGKVRKEYSTKSTRLWGGTSPACYVFIPLDEEDAGKTMRIEIISKVKYVGLLRTMFCGSYVGIWHRIIRDEGVELVIAILMLVIGVICVMIGTGLRLCYHKRTLLEYISWGILLVSIWLFSNLHVRQLLFPNLSIISDVPFFALMLIPFPFAAYMDMVQKERYHIAYLILEFVALENGVLCTILQVIDKYDFTTLFLLIAGVAVGLVIVIAVTILMDAESGHLREYWTSAVGMVFAAAVAMIQIAMYLHVNKPFRPGFMMFGLLILLVVATVNTVQDLIRLDQDKQQALMESKARMQFFANMSHEIRTPINAILGMDELILKESRDPQTVERAQDIHTAGHNLLSLINDILDFSKAESGKITLLPGIYSVADMVYDMHSLMEYQAQKKGLKLSCSIDENTPIRLLGDEKRIRQIISNLMSNAIKYTEKGTVTLSVGWKEWREDHVILTIDVEDTGNGIRKDDIDRLFHSFERLEEKKNHHIEGTGLGLSITKQLVDLMGGTIRVSSELRVGSKFSVEIPQIVAAEQRVGRWSVEAAHRKQQDCVKESDSLRAPEARILIVDDVEMNLKVMQGLLKTTQIQIDTASSGEECLKKIVMQRYHLIFLDHMMPQMDGIETFQKMQTLADNCNVHTPVIMLTANAIEGADKEYIRLGFHDYLSKPVEYDALLKCLYKYLPSKYIL